MIFKKNYAARLRELDRKEKEIRMRERVRQREIELGLRPKRRKPAWSKVMMSVVYAICIEIIIYAEIVMWVKYDLSALYALIGVPAAMMGVFWSYAAKSKAENTKGGITYDAAMQSQPQPDPETDDPGGAG